MRKWIIAGVAVVAVVAIIAGVALASGGDSTEKPVLVTATAKVRDLQEEVSVSGVLERAEQRTVNAVSAGSGQTGGGSATVSSVSLKDGSDLKAGQGILAIDGRTSVAVDGTLPFFRKLDVGAQGADVAELETVLLRDGFGPGAVDQTFTEQTRFALAQWQAKRGYPGASPSPGSAVNMALQQSQNYALGPQSSAGITIGPPAVKSAARTTTRRGGVGALSGPVLSIAATSTSVSRGSFATFTVITDGTPHPAFNVDVMITGVSDRIPAGAMISVALPQDATSTSFQVFVLANATAPDSFLSATLQDTVDYDVGVPAVATVDVPSSATPVVTISGSTSVTPGQSAVLTITADVAPSEDLQINLSVGGSAQADTDYAPFPPYVVLLAGQSSTTVTVQTKTTNTIKPNRFVVVGLAQSARYTPGPLTSATVTILGDSGAVQPTATITAGNLRVNGGTPAQFTIGFDRPTSVATEIGLAFGGDAVPGSDFNPPGGVVTVPAGQTSLTVNVPTLNNGLVQPDKNLVVSLTSGAGYAVGSPSSAQVLILAPTLPKLNLVASSNAVGLGGGVLFTITADQAPVKDLSIQYQVTGTAQQGKEIQPLPGAVTLSAGQTSVSVPILTLNTNVYFLPTDMITVAGPTRLGKVYVKEGDAVPAGTPLFSLTEPNIAVTMQVGAGDRTKLKVGQSGTAQVQDSSVSAPGVITKIDDFPTTDKETKKQYFEGTFQVQGKLDAADGTPVTVKVITKQAKGALTVPIAAVIQDGQGRDVIRVIDLERGGKTREVPVKTGMTEGSYIEIVSGLKVDDVVVIELNQSGTQ